MKGPGRREAASASSAAAPIAAVALCAARRPCVQAPVFCSEVPLPASHALPFPTAPAPRSHQQVLPVFCFDPRFLRASAWGTPKTGPFRAQFLLESVADLKAQLRAIGSDLLVAMGPPEEVGGHPPEGTGCGPAGVAKRVLLRRLCCRRGATRSLHAHHTAIAGLPSAAGPAAPADRAGQRAQQRGAGAVGGHQRGAGG